MLTDERQKDMFKRLKRIEGQIRGIMRMVEEPRYCPDILNQIAAVRRALDAASLLLVEDHINTCVTTAIKKNKGKQSVRELTKTLDRFIR